MCRSTTPTSNTMRRPTTVAPLTTSNPQNFSLKTPSALLNSAFGVAVGIQNTKGTPAKPCLGLINACTILTVPKAKFAESSPGVPFPGNPFYDGHAVPAPVHLEYGCDVHRRLQPHRSPSRRGQRLVPDSCRAARSPRRRRIQQPRRSSALLRPRTQDQITTKLLHATGGASRTAAWAGTNRRVDRVRAAAGRAGAGCGPELAQPLEHDGAPLRLGERRARARARQCPLARLRRAGARRRGMRRRRPG